MTISKKDLNALKNDIKALEKKIDKLITAAGKSEEAKTTKRVATNKTPAKKKPAQLTATDQVLKIIKRSKKGINIKRVGKGIYVRA